jgi:uncharacterized sporulation protein YeaH/YhbH (DUF444 family)
MTNRKIHIITGLLISSFVKLMTEKPTCEKCGKTFYAKAQLQYHINKNACKENTHFCNMCGKGFTTATSMYRHMRQSCKVKQANEREKNEIYEKLLELESNNKELSEKVNFLEKTAKTQKITKNINNGTINNNSWLW